MLEEHRALQCRWVDKHSDGSTESLKPQVTLQQNRHIFVSNFLFFSFSGNAKVVQNVVVFMSHYVRNTTYHGPLKNMAFGYIKCITQRRSLLSMRSRHFKDLLLL